MALNGQLFRFVLFQTQAEEFYLFGCCHHIVLDGLGMALVSRRVATIYSAMVAGSPVPDAYFGSAQDLIDLESGYEASTDYLEDEAYWRKNLPPEGGHDYQLPRPTPADPCSPSASVNWTRPPSPGCKRWQRSCASVAIRSSPRRPHSWCMHGREAVRRWHWISRSAGAYVPSRRRSQGCSPELCRWSCRRHRRQRSPIFVSTLTSRYDNC